VYVSPAQAEMLVGVAQQVIRHWAETGRVRSATKRLYSAGHLVVRTADVIEAAVVDGRIRLADVVEPMLWPQPCETCGVRPPAGP